MAAPKKITTIIQNGAISSKQGTAAKTQRLTVAQVGNAAQLARTLSEMQQATADATAAVRGNPHSAPCIVRGQGCTSGQQAIIRHTLGRRYTGWWCCRAITNSAQFVEIPPGSGSYPPGASPDKVLVVLSGGTGTYDFCITGD